jgi:hypothetical protein
MPGGGKEEGEARETPDLAARLRDYADLYGETYGVREEPADLVPYMLKAFLNGDADFRKALREKAGKGRKQRYRRNA